MTLLTTSSDWLEHSFFQGLQRIQRAWRYGVRSPLSPLPDLGEAKRPEVAGSGVRGDDRMQLARRVEWLAADRLCDMGAVVSLTPHKAHFDIQACGATVEVKAARYNRSRWQWNLRDSQADLYLFACVAGGAITGWFVIPGHELAGRSYVEVWAADPAAHTGQWSAYYNAWDLAAEALRAGAHPWQIPLEVSA